MPKRKRAPYDIMDDAGIVAASPLIQAQRRVAELEGENALLRAAIMLVANGTITKDIEALPILARRQEESPPCDTA